MDGTGSQASPISKRLAVRRKRRVAMQSGEEGSISALLQLVEMVKLTVIRAWVSIGCPFWR